MYLQLDCFHLQDQPIVKHPAKFLPIEAVTECIHLRKKEIVHQTLNSIKYYFNFLLFKCVKLIGLIELSVHYIFNSLWKHHRMSFKFSQVVNNRSRQNIPL